MAEEPVEVNAPLLHQVDDTPQPTLQAHGNVQERSVLVQLGPDPTVTITLWSFILCFHLKIYREEEVTSNCSETLLILPTELFPDMVNNTFSYYRLSFKIPTKVKRSLTFYTIKL